MVSQQSVHKQLKKIDFNPHGWNRSEVAELQNVLLPDEEIYECVNGLYEGGFALLVASDVRVLLIDKKPLSFLNVEDLRFDMINEIDYNHRMMGASIIITTGSKTLSFRSYNKERLRKLIGHVQHCMAENKKQQSSHAEGQNQHLEQINQQLQAYLVAQYKQQQKLQEQLVNMQSDNGKTGPVQLEEAAMSSQLKDYLYAHGLMETYRQETGQDPVAVQPPPTPAPVQAQAAPAPKVVSSDGSQLDEIYAEGIQEVFGRRAQPGPVQPTPHSKLSVFEVNPFKVAISKLQLASVSRRFGLSLPSLPSWPGHDSQSTQTLNLNSTTSSGSIT